MNDTIFEFVKSEEAAYALPISIIDGWEWNMKEHIRLSTLYKNSQFSTGNSDNERDDKPFKNIIRPILNLQYRTEGFDVKDIVLYVDDEEQYFKSFLVKKYHDRWAKKNEMDSFIDEGLESVVDYGGALFRDVGHKKPEVIQLASIAFCDQTNMLSGPIGIKHYYDPSQLQEMAAYGWGDSSKGADITIDEAIVASKNVQVPDAKNGKENKTPGKYIECYEVNGVLPESWLKTPGSASKFVRQTQILVYYFDKDGEKVGKTLFKGRAPRGMFKVALRDKIHGRALGFGGIEELFDAQVWTNYGEIAMKGLLDAATKIILKTTDDSLKTRHPKGLKDLDNLDVIEIADGRDIGQVNTSPVNIRLFDNAVSEWENTGRTIGAASEAVLGESPASGTPFKLQDVIIQQGLGLHEYRQGKYATAIGYIYTDWVLPRLRDDLKSGKKFLEELSLKELQKVSDAIVDCETNKVIKEKILNGQEIIPSDIENVRAGIKQQFMKRGNKHFLEIFKGEMNDIPLSVDVSIKGKQKDLAKMTDKVVNIIRQIIASPQVLDDPRMAELFNQVIEYSGMSPIDFATTGARPAQVAAPLAPANQELTPTMV